ncbi:MAG: O-antigen ligase family protein [Phascolarctobacterium sp.]|nr:O-antigen ligase family protein [Phascolarctobacterium sp.]
MVAYLQYFMLGMLLSVMLVQEFSWKIANVFMALVIVSFLLLLFKSPQARINFLSNKLVLMAWGCLAISLIPSVVFSVNIGHSFHQYMKIVFYWPIVFAVVTAVRDKVQLLRYFTLLVFGFLVVECLYAFINWYVLGGTVRVGGFGPLINIFAAYICMYSVLLYVAILDPHFSNKQKSCVGLALIIYLMGTLAPNSRAAWLAMAFSFFVIGIPYFFKSKKIAMGILSLFIICGLAFVYNPYLHSRFVSITNITTDASNTARLYAWKGAGRAFLQHPFSGVGLRCWELTPYKDYQVPNSNRSIRLPHAHNNVINLAAESGILAVCGYLFLQLSFVWIAIGGLRKRFNPYDMMILGVVLVYNCCGMFDNVFASPTIMRTYWLLMAVLIVFKDYYLKDYDK